MTDDVPVSDVLLEATEYLCKLGTNLKLRSETLKEKRISKSKLKNTHAVQKAADKLLLICELSKKSLENVEVGVKKILTVCVRDRGPIPAKPASFKRETDFHYIKDGSRMLRMSENVSLAHFKSAKVKAKNMSLSKHEKYPVFFDCKLYRRRKRKEIKAKLKSISENRQGSAESSSTYLDNEGKVIEKTMKVEKNIINGTGEDVDNRDNESPTGRNSDTSKSTIQEERNTKDNEKGPKLKSFMTTEHNEEDLSDRKESKEGRENKQEQTPKKKYSRIVNDSSNDESLESPRLPARKGKRSENVQDSSESKETNHALVDSSDEQPLKDEKNIVSKPADKEKLGKCSMAIEKSHSDHSDNRKEDNEEKSRKDTNHSHAVNSVSKKTKPNDDSSDKEPLKENKGILSKPADKEKSPKSVDDSSNDIHIHKENKQEKSLKKKYFRIVDDSSNEESSESPKLPAYEGKSPENVDDDSDPKKTKHALVDSSDEQPLEDKKESASKPAYQEKLPEFETGHSDNDKRKEDNERKSRKDTNNSHYKQNTANSESNKTKHNDDSSDEQPLKENKGISSKPADKEKSPESEDDSSNDVHIHKKRKLSHLESTEEEKQNNQEPKTVENEGVNLITQPQRPLLKLVSLSKLLKPDIIKEDTKKVDSKSKSSYKNKSKLEEKKIKEEKFWEERRKEVLLFQPKKFYISVCRLPELTYDFLISNKIKKITQQGETIATRGNNKNVRFQTSDKEDDQLSGGEKQLKSKKDTVTNSEKQPTPDMNTVKSALLDSDSDKDQNTVKLTTETEKVKKTLLNDSDSDENMRKRRESVVSQEKEESAINANKNDGNIVETSETESNTALLSKNMEGEINNSNQESKNMGTEIKNSDQESEKPSDETDIFKITTNQESCSNKNKDSTPAGSDKEKKSPEKSPITPRSKSKRKNMMESMHAKKMLLTYSSSSDTEDEKLKHAINEIKTSLLEGSDEDVMEKVKENHRKRLLASSSDEDDTLPKIQKGKENNETADLKSTTGDSKSTKENDDENSGDDSTKKNGRDNSSEVDAKADEETSSSSKMGRSKTKPSSSSQNSDTQDTDKEIDGMTNLKTLTKSSRRRASTSTSQAEDSGTNTRSKTIPKVPVIKMADLLQAATESSGESAGEGEANDDLPPMTLSGLNGDDALDLGKDQLLEDSDASSAHNKSSDEAKQEESEEDDNPKSKRRKALAISSDSDGGGRRKSSHKAKGTFTDSEEENGEEKKSKRRKRETDSDGSAGSSDSAGKKKRRRIKQVDDSDGSGSGSENEGRKHGRKNIRKVMGKNQLEEATKRAARREKERVARIAERQKLYNNLQFDESGKPDEVVLDKVILDFDPDTKEPLIAVDTGLVKKLKPHQANGIKFMWDACFESAKRIKKDKGSGCILAHCMGLGKTLQVVTLTHTLLAHSELTGVRRVLVVCPLSTVLNWVNEFNMWLKHTESDVEVDVYELSRYKQNSERAWQLQQWFTGGGVCVLGYEMFRNLSADNVKKFRKKMLQTFQQSLVTPGPDLVVCDEGHLLKNEKTSLSQSMNRVKTLRRIVLTGTPLQNNLKEYYCMVQFVKPNLLGKYNEYLNRFVNPITNGQYTDSTEQDIRVMKRRSHVLHKMLDGAVQRRDYGVLAPFLPPKHENVLFITLSDVQVKLYQHYLDNYSRRPIAGKSGFLFPDFQSLQRIWTHPLVLKYNSERYEILQQKKRDKEEEEDDSEGSLADFIDDESTPDESTTEESSDDSEASDDSRKKNKKKAKKEKKNKAGARRGTRANPGTVEVDPEEKPVPEALEEARNENPTEWWMRLVEEEELEDMRNSHKLVLLFDILRQCETIGDKLLVFSQSLYSLDLIEHFLGKVDEATQEARIDPKLGNHVGSWSPGVDYFRLDGSTSCENRSLWCKHFNREDNPRARLFLISTRAGGLGINLVAANRVVIFDVSWNPSHDVQSIFRVYRFGQKKPCYVYRFLAMGTMEEKIYERQVTKQAISKRVIDEQQIDRHYAENDLAELYKFEPKPPEPRPLPPLPKDRLFAEMLREHDKEIYKYHEHDSLLENKEEETLTEEERKAAWEDFENEKNRPPPAPFPSGWPMHNGMAPNPLLAQQQQQLAYAAIVAMLRKDMPNVNEAQIRDMLPLIYNANPAMFGGYDYGLMQKMGEIYKYAPGMMNPMMSAMGGNAAVGGGMSGTSGLQYEPPWQRQQQQQQQMRLQQMLQQQQNSMNAKYYAGGLGSRDPVAMAMQQQAAREIMLGEPAAGRGRPRGRPPLARPPAAPADVVNLDSD